MSLSRSRDPESGVLWLDLGDPMTSWHPPSPHEQWQDHGLGLLRTILHQKGIPTSLASTRMVRRLESLNGLFSRSGTLVMNVRSYTYPAAKRAARLYKQANPRGRVLVGGMHATVALDEMLAVEDFDHICQGAGEKTIVDLVSRKSAFPRSFKGQSSASMEEWPLIDRKLWPKPPWYWRRAWFAWPLEPACGWGPPPVATVLTSRVCPWKCTFCNENSFIDSMGRRSVDSVIDELNGLDRQYGPLGSAVIHDSMFFMNPRWLEQWLEAYPRKARKVWPYWAAARADTVCRWPELFEALVRETGWDTVSIGFESGSDRVLRILNKECTEEDNDRAIEHLNRIGDDMEKKGQTPPKFWANIMLGIPGENPEDAIKTVRMLLRMKRVIPSLAFYAPYPGSALGHQLIAEGRSLMGSENYHRFPNDEKVKGVDYKFYDKLLTGGYDVEINRGMPPSLQKGIGLLRRSMAKA